MKKQIYLSILLSSLIGCGGPSSSPTATNTKPIAKAQTVTLHKVVSKKITLLGTDADGDKLTYSIVDKPSLGKLTGKAPNLIYTTIANDYGRDSFTFKVNDGKADSSYATVKIVIEDLASINQKENSVPLVNAGQNKSIIVGEPITLTATASDNDGTISTYIWRDKNLNILSQNKTFSKDDFTEGVHTLTITVTDNQGATATDSITITVNPPAQANLPILKSGQTEIFSNFDDGYYQSGKDYNYTRDDLTEVVTDHVTNLKWYDHENPLLTHNEAKKYCSDLQIDGGRWRLPSMKELQTLFYFGSDAKTVNGFATDYLHPIFKTSLATMAWSSDLDVTTTYRVWRNDLRGDDHLPDHGYQYATQCVKNSN